MKSYHYAIIGVLTAVVSIAACVGWVLNIVKIFGIEVLGTEFVLRIVGIFVPFVGAIYGYF